MWTGIAYFASGTWRSRRMFVLGPFVARESLGGASSWGAIVTCAGVGSLVGAAAALRLKPRRPLATGFLLFGLVALEPALLARPFPTAVVAAAAAIGFAGSAFGNALWFTTLQERIPDEVDLARQRLRLAGLDRLQAGRIRVRRAARRRARDALDAARLRRA